MYVFFAMHTGWVALLSQLTDVGGLCKDKFIGAYILYSCVVIFCCTCLSVNLICAEDHCDF